MRQHTSKMIESLLSKRNVERTVIEGTSGHESTRCTGHVVQVEICVVLDVYGWTCIFCDGGPRNRRRWHMRFRQLRLPTAGGQWKAHVSCHHERICCNYGCLLRFYAQRYVMCRSSTFASARAWMAVALMQ